MQETEAQRLVDLGNEILANVDSASEAEKHVDSRLSDSTTRWYNLVSLMDSQESAVNKVLIDWRAYVSMYHGTQAFITQMVKMVGTEPLESSNGNNTLLPTYRVSMSVSIESVSKIHSNHHS